MKTKAIVLTGLGVLVTLGVVAHATGNLESLQGRFGAAPSITAAVSPSTPREDIVVAGDSGVEVASYQFTSNKEAFLVTDLTINNKNDLGLSDDNILKVYLNYEDSSGVAQTEAGSLSTGVATFTGLELYVPKDDTVDMDILVDLNVVSGGADSGETIRLYLTPGAVAVGQTSNKTVSVVGKPADLKMTNLMHVYETKPTLSLSASSPSGMRSVSSVDNMFIFNVAADSSEKVDAKKVTIDLTSDGDFDTAAAITAYLLDDTGASMASSPVTFTNASQAQVSFKVTGEVAKSDDEDWTLQLNTSALLNEDAGVDDPLTVSIELGSAAGGKITNGGFWWSDTNTTAKWVGNVSSTTLAGNTLTY
ncbi:MAG: hypothetical protein AAB383_03075 [Patescibacteria group bacterium]